jgi:hypothetical protein
MSWKTTIMGIVAVLSGLGMFGKIISDFAAGRPVGFEEVSIAVATIGTGLGLIAARDNDVTSEDAGAE